MAHASRGTGNSSAHVPQDSLAMCAQPGLTPVRVLLAKMVQCALPLPSRPLAKLLLTVKLAPVQALGTVPTPLQIAARELRKLAHLPTHTRLKKPVTMRVYARLVSLVVTAASRLTNAAQIHVDAEALASTRAILLPACVETDGPAVLAIYQLLCANRTHVRTAVSVLTHLVGTPASAREPALVGQIAM